MLYTLSFYVILELYKLVVLARVVSKLDLGYSNAILNVKANKIYSKESAYSYSSSFK